MAQLLYDPETRYHVALTRTWALLKYFLLSISLATQVVIKKGRQLIKQQVKGYVREREREGVGKEGKSWRELKGGRGNGGRK